MMPRVETTTSRAGKEAIAAFWDNLDPTKPADIDSVRVGDGIYYLSDAANHRFVVEWSRLTNYYPEFDEVQTFQLILLDPEYYPTETGDGIIQLQSVKDRHPETAAARLARQKLQSLGLM